MEINYIYLTRKYKTVYFPVLTLKRWDILLNFIKCFMPDFLFKIIQLAFTIFLFRIHLIFVKNKFGLVLIFRWLFKRIFFH